MKELLNLTDLSETNVYCIHEAVKVVVVYKNEELVFATFLVIPPYFKNFDNSQKLIVVGLILGFR